MLWIPIATSLASFAVALSVAVYNYRESRQASARGVLLAETTATGHITPDNTPTVVVRNDGSHAVRITSLVYACGNVRTVDKHRPEVWGLTGLPFPSVLAPGAEYSTPVPSVPHVSLGQATGHIGPVAVVADDRGRRWHITGPAGRRRMPDPLRGGWRPLGWAVERWGWLGRLDERVENWQITKREERPGLLPVIPVLVDGLWGWRAGGAGKSFDGPLDAPRRWRYANGSRFDSTDVPWVPIYPWGPTPTANSQSAPTTGAERWGAGRTSR